jgi:RNA 3'-terminal phosphate cyclase (GTP)
LSDEPITLDGAYGEGGGQILRTGLAMSSITGRSVKIHSIRENRPKPGLANQHLTGLLAMQRICGASVEGDQVGSTSISFSPGNIEHGEYGFRVGTAGSITLVLQTILPTLASVKGRSQISVVGGTDVKWSPPIDYYHLVLFPLLKKVGLNCSLRIRQRGYYPKGGGEVEVNVEASGDFGQMAIGKSDEINYIPGIINITGLPSVIAERIRGSLIQHLPDGYSSIIKINVEHMKHGPSQGVGVTLAASDGNNILGASALGERGKSAEKIGKECASQLIKEIEGDAGLDIYASDQLLPYLAFSEPGGFYKTRRLTNHTKTNVWTIEQFLGEIFVIDEKQNITRISKR